MFFEVGLRDIADIVVSGDMPPNVLSSSQISKIICSRFEQTSLRTQLLDEIIQKL
jgi:hypothetical protein